MRMIPTGAALTWTSWDGNSFSSLRWEAKIEIGEKPKALLIAIHGLQGAASDYEPLGAYLSSLGITTWALDLRGQGNDLRKAQRGDLASWSDWSSDLSAFFRMAREEFPGVPIFYAGESMGGAILNRYLAEAAPENQPAGVILLAPVVTLPKPLPRWLELSILFVLKFLPRQRLNLGIILGGKNKERAALLTRNQEHVAWIKTAPHRVDSFTLRFFYELGELVKRGSEFAPGVRVPVLLLYGGHDVYFRPKQIEKYFQLLGAMDKQFCFFPDSYHLLLHDFDHAEVLAKVNDWLFARIGSD